MYAKGMMGAFLAYYRAEYAAACGFRLISNKSIAFTPFS
jgi:hypothetical protein